MRLGKLLVGACAVALLVTGCAGPTSRPGPSPAAHPTHTGSPAPSAAAGTAVAGHTRASTPPPSRAAVVRAVNHCARNPDAQRVLVDLAVQHAWMCARHHTVFSTAITSGMVGQWTSTPTGYFHIEGRDRNTTLTLNTGATYQVKYWIPFQAPLFGFHDASWQTFPFGSPKYKTDGSHGCVHMPLAAMRFLYNWAQIGASVHIWA